jgi:hypothetical protein
MDNLSAVKTVTKILWSMRLIIMELVDGAKLSNNPQKIRNEVNDFFEKRTSKYRKLVGQQEKNNTSKSFDISSANAEIKKVALFFWFSADRYWNKLGNRNGYRAAWYYTKSGEAFELAGDFASAGELYHFAGHQFRKFDSQRKAMDLYFKSALIIRKNLKIDHPSTEIANRSIHRAIGIAKNIGDEEILCQMMKKNRIYKKLTDEYKTQNIWD